MVTAASGVLEVSIIPLAAAARVDPAGLAVTAEMRMAAVAMLALAAVAARVDRHLLRAQQEGVPLAVLVAREELQALEVLELRQV